MSRESACGRVVFAFSLTAEAHFAAALSQRNTFGASSPAIYRLPRASAASDRNSSPWLVRLTCGSRFATSWVTCRVTATAPRACSGGDLSSLPSISVVAVTPVISYEPSFRADPAILIVCPGMNPSAIHDPTERVIVSAFVSRKFNSGPAVTVKVLAGSSLVRVVSTIVSDAALTLRTLYVPLLVGAAFDPVTVTNWSATNPSRIQLPSVRVMVLPPVNSNSAATAVSLPIVGCRRAAVGDGGAPCAGRRDQPAPRSVDRNTPISPPRLLTSAANTALLSDVESCCTASRILWAPVAVSPVSFGVPFPSLSKLSDVRSRPVLIWTQGLFPASSVRNTPAPRTAAYRRLALCGSATRSVTDPKGILAANGMTPSPGSKRTVS